MTDQTDFNDVGGDIAGQVDSAKTLEQEREKSLKVAKDTVSKLNGKDPGEWFEDGALKALALLSVESKPDYERAIFAARKAKVGLRDLKSEVRKRARISNSKKPIWGGGTHETHSNLAEISATQGLEANFETHSEAHSAVRCGKLIVCPGMLPEIVDAAEQILVRVEDDFYQRSGYLVRICVKRVETVRGITRPEGAVTIIPIDAEYLLVQIQATFFAITCLRCSTYLQLK